MCKNLPPKIQKEIIFEKDKYNIYVPKSLNDVEYVIEISWWRKWCDYVNVESMPFNYLLQNYQSVSNSSEIMTLKNTLEGQNFSFKEMNLSNESEDFYSKPGKIINKNLISDESRSFSVYSTRCKLRHDLHEEYDYVRVDYKCWRFLSAWYGYDFALICPSIENSFDSVTEPFFTS